jgi:hypothetical protein
MTPPKRILCDLAAITVGMLIGLIQVGCTDSKASGPVHGLEIGDPVLVRSEFPTVEACEQFANRLIVVLHKAGHEIPKNMRCL